MPIEVFEWFVPLSVLAIAVVGGLYFRWEGGRLDRRLAEEHEKRKRSRREH